MDSPTDKAMQRKRKKGKKLEDWERDYYRRNIHKVEFKQRYTDAEQEVADAWGI